MPSQQVTEMQKMLEEFKGEVKKSIELVRSEVLTVNRNQAVYEQNGAPDPRQLARLASAVTGLQKDINIIAVSHKAQQTRVAEIAKQTKNAFERLARLDVMVTNIVKDPDFPSETDLFVWGGEPGEGEEHS